MDKHTHTEGPWTYNEDAVNITAPDGSIVAELDNCTAWDTVANARLIAASPRMLSALRLVAQLPGFEPSEPYGEAVLEAIKQATGQ